MLITSCSSAFPLPIAFGVSFVAFLAVALACHRELYLARPLAQYLTEFYLWMSFGGALGGLFSAILAPQLFMTIFEFPLLAVASLVVSPFVINAKIQRRDWSSAAKLLAAGVGILALVNAVVWMGWVEGSYTLRLLVLVSLLALMFAGKASRVCSLRCWCSCCLLRRSCRKAARHATARAASLDRCASWRRREARSATFCMARQTTALSVFAAPRDLP